MDRPGVLFSDKAFQRYGFMELVLFASANPPYVNIGLAIS
jgi:hypothetical protein